ncbi:neutral zinc metallopeptidase [Inquilinus sp. Marseille-Q2685]|uniref:KPN_02809 family neutral zinc metallopeptidase n=1 Tax=Inquilinus sp. Marseille-Q2685 TaxID=2866581 RepID=UPI001CE42F73|nr:neutral zinc metallopeptidase [Inquilinus sp. Marseille-Q2685]
MRWQNLRRSSNVEDRRGMRPAAVGGVGGIGAIVIVLVALFFGVDPSALLQQVDPGPGPSQTETASGPSGAQQDEMSQFLAAVLGSTEDTWGAVFQEAGSRYAPPRLVRFSGAVQSACGSASAAMGPFYCPADQKVYIDTDFFDELSRRFGAPGEFAEAYVVAHEVGHHVQNLLGIMDKVSQLRARGGVDGNALSVRVELQADCFAGVWAKRGDQQSRFIEPGDIESAMKAAAAGGDDALQKQSQGYVVPDSFTHGSSEQRVRWFRRGFDSGTPTTCDTFSAQTL